MRLATFTSVIFITTTVFGSTDTNGPNGINSTGSSVTGLDGAGITIGQVEVGRAAKNPPDTNGTINNTFVVPFQVFDDQGVTPNSLGPSTAAGIHAEGVASVMISTDTTDPDGGGPRTAPKGTAPGSKLLSVAAEVINSYTNEQAQESFAESSQQIVTYAKSHTMGIQDLRAINMSFGEALPGDNPVYDGSSTLTSYVDWSAKTDDILYVVAGNEYHNTTPEAGVPNDNFNGMTIASTTKDANGVYSVVASSNDFTMAHHLADDRTAISLMAPGENVDVDSLGNTRIVDGGTSIAAPHVTGTVALLQEYGEAHVGAPKFPTTDFRHHEVMKAILMNSTDKLIDNHTIMAGGQLVPQGGLLGMDRTVTDQNGHDWRLSTANDDDFQTQSGQIALDPQMGTGELDAKRAIQQLQGGEHQSFQASPLDYSEVPVIGWDYGQTRPLGINSNNVYKLNQYLVPGSFVSITLAFDRTVDKSGTNGVYHAGDTFSQSTDTTHPGEDQLSDLDIYLLPKGSTSLSQAIAYSDAFGTVDHLFYQIPFNMGGEYEFWINEFNDNTDPENYAVAWWADGEGVLTSGRGDMNEDGHIDARDIAAMEKALTNEAGYANSISESTSQISLLGDVNGDGIFNNADLQYLLDFLKNGNGSTSVPEPSSFLLLALGLPFLLKTRKR